ncbi:hypothetical protein Drorol1_Dr00010825, partial [Drosera rotundifolia]
ILKHYFNLDLDISSTMLVFQSGSELLPDLDLQFVEISLFMFKISGRVRCTKEKSLSSSAAGSVQWSGGDEPPRCAALRKTNSKAQRRRRTANPCSSRSHAAAAELIGAAVLPPDFQLLDGEDKQPTLLDLGLKRKRDVDGLLRHLSHRFKHWALGTNGPVEYKVIGPSLATIATSLRSAATTAFTGCERTTRSHLLRDPPPPPLDPPPPPLVEATTATSLRSAATPPPSLGVKEPPEATSFATRHRLREIRHRLLLLKPPPPPP